MKIPQKKITLFSVIVIGLSLCSADVFYQCADSPIDPVGSKFIINCNAPRKVIIVESAIIGITDGYKSPNQCPITNNTCTKEVSFAAEYCTGYNNSCEIAQRLLFFNESRFSCPAFGLQRANFINVNYSCVYPTALTYGDACHFDDNLYLNTTVYISSYPNFPDGMPSSGPFQCLCSFAPSTLVNGSGGWIRIRARLVKLSGFNSDPCPENLTFSVGGETRLSFCSPSIATNNETTVALNSMFTISYERRSYVAAATSKFFIELKAENVSNAYTIGRMTCTFGSSSDPFTNSVAGRTSMATFKSDSLALPVTPAASSQLQEQLSSTSTTTPMTLKSSSMSTDIVVTSSENQQLSHLQSALTSGAIAGIVIGTVSFVVVVVIIIVIAILFVKKQRGKKMESRHGELPSFNELNKRESPGPGDRDHGFSSSGVSDHKLEEIEETPTYDYKIFQPTRNSTEAHEYESTISRVEVNRETPINQYEPLRKIAESQNNAFAESEAGNAYQPLELAK